MTGTKKEQNLQPVSNILETILTDGKGPLSDQFLRWKIWNNWAEIVGPVVGGYSSPVGFEDGTLYVWVKSPVHMQELSFGLDLLRVKVNQFAKRAWIKAIRLTLDRKDVPQTEDAPQDFRDFIGDNEK